jgi:hypothetical protein
MAHTSTGQQSAVHQWIQRNVLTRNSIHIYVSRPTPATPYTRLHVRILPIPPSNKLRKPQCKMGKWVYIFSFRISTVSLLSAQVKTRAFKKQDPTVIERDGDADMESVG